MVRDIFVGVDGGGTKTRIRIEDVNRKVLGETETGASNIRLSVKDAWAVIEGGINRIFAGAGIEMNDPEYCFHAGMGLAGTEVEKAGRDFLARRHGFKTIKLESDAYTACLGAHEGQDGAIIIIGTGVVGYQIEGDKITKVGGWGFPQGDEGGGAWLGLEAARLTFKSLDGRLRPTSLLNRVYGRFDNDVRKFADWANSAKSTQFAELAPLVIEYAEKKDYWALRLMKRAAGEINEINKVFEKNIVNKDRFLPCSFAGGVSAFIESRVDDSLRKRLVPAKYDAAAGAVFMIRKNVLGHI